jgi:DHA1 family bicyclomycin/chloramphenicol resistance-like MFS transporter
VAASSGPVIARAIVRDRYHGAEAARVMALLAAAMSVIPLAAPVLGSWLLYAFDWRAQFALLMLFGLLTLAGVRTLTESCPSIGQGRLALTRVFGQFAACLVDRRFAGFLLCGAACFASLFTWISSTSWIVIDLLGVSPPLFGYTFMFGVSGYMGGSLLSARLAPRLGVERTVAAGVGVALLGTLALAGFALGGPLRLWPVLLAVLWSSTGCGLCLPNAQMGAISQFPQAAGGASAVFGFLQTAAAAFAGLLVGQLYDNSLRPTAFIMLGSVCVAACGLVLLKRAPRGAPGG